MTFEVKTVMVLGYPAGCLWDIIQNGEAVARVTYHGDNLHVVRGRLPASRAVVEAAIEAHDGA